IETSLVKRMIEVVLADAEQAFRPLSPVHFNIDRLETNPRFAAITRPANAAILVRLRIDMEDRGGNIELMLPYATIEPIRDVAVPLAKRLGQPRTTYDMFEMADQSCNKVEAP